MESSGNKCRRAACRGSTLVEVLVALSILSVGLAGLAATQMKTLSVLHDVAYQSRAALLAADMSEQLRRSTALSSAAQTEWSARLRAELPAGEGEICLDSTPRDGAPDAPACDGLGEFWAIKIWWHDSRGNVDSDNATRSILAVLRP